MKKKHYIIFSRFLLLVVIVIILTNFFSNNRCQTEIPQINQEATTREMEEYFSLKAYLFTPFMITNKLDYETEFIQNIENIKREYLQREIITAYLQKEPITADVTGSLNQKDFFSNIKETQFYELSTEEKVNILDTSNVNTTYRFGDDVLAMNRRKIYRFGEFQIALCGEYFGVGISCVNDIENPFQIVEQGNDNTFTGALIRKVGEQQRHYLLLPQVGNGPVSLWIKNGKLFLTMHVVPEGEYFGAIDWYGAVYVLEEVRGNESKKYGRVFQQCYDTAFKDVDVQYLGAEFSLSGAIFWDNRLFTEDIVVSPSTCLLGN